MVVDWDGVEDPMSNQKSHADEVKEDMSFTSKTVDEVSSLPTFQSTHFPSTHPPATTTTNTSINNNTIVSENDFSFMEELGGFTSSSSSPSISTTGTISFHVHSIIQKMNKGNYEEYYYASLIKEADKSVIWGLLD